MADEIAPRVGSPPWTGQEYKSEKFFEFRAAPMNTRALVPEDLDRDVDFERRAWGRTLAACVIANRDCVDPEPVLKAIWPDDRHAAARLKSAVSPTSTGNAPALLLDVVQAFRSLAPASAALALFEKGLSVSLDGLNSITSAKLGQRAAARRLRRRRRAGAKFAVRFRQRRRPWADAKNSALGCGQRRA